MSSHSQLALISLLAVVTLPSEASAIQCDGDFQIVRGQPISTPFCRDRELGAVARAQGFRVSDDVIRNNPAKKEELCRYLNSDIRVKVACADVSPDGSRR